MEGKVWLFIEIHKKLKDTKKNILAAENCTCIWPILTNLTLRMWILPAGGSLASVRDELGNRRLRRSSRKGGVGELGRGGTQKIIGFNPIKARIHAGQSQKSIQISCNAEHPRWMYTSGYIARYIKRFHRIRKLKRFCLNPVLQECFPIKTQEDYNEVSLTCVRLNKIII